MDIKGFTEGNYYLVLEHNEDNSKPFILFYRCAYTDNGFEFIELDNFDLSFNERLFILNIHNYELDNNKFFIKDITDMLTSYKESVDITNYVGNMLFNNKVIKRL